MWTGGSEAFCVHKDIDTLIQLYMQLQKILYLEGTSTCRRGRYDDVCVSDINGAHTLTDPQSFWIRKPHNSYLNNSLALLFEYMCTCMPSATREHNPKLKSEFKSVIIMSCSPLSLPCVWPNYLCLALVSATYLIRSRTGYFWWMCHDFVAVVSVASVEVLAAPVSSAANGMGSWELPRPPYSIVT